MYSSLLLYIFIILCHKNTKLWKYSLWVKTQGHTPILSSSALHSHMQNSFLFIYKAHNSGSFNLLKFETVRNWTEKENTGHKDTIRSISDCHCFKWGTDKPWESCVLVILCYKNHTIHINNKTLQESSLVLKLWINI